MAYLTKESYEDKSRTNNPNDKEIDETVARMADVLFSSLHTDEEQFLAIQKLREGVAKHFDSTKAECASVADFNDQRAGRLKEYTKLIVGK